jgi:glycosyltransferase involved in cell wall biosynthesis
MRIVQAAGWYFPDSLGGTEIYAAALASRLRKRGHDVLVAAPEPGLLSPRRYQYENIPVYRYPTPVKPTRAEARSWVTARGALCFHRWLQRERPDVVHFHTFVTGLGVPEVEAARAAGARVIVTTHAASLAFLCERGTMMRCGDALCDGAVDPATCAACALQHRGIPMPVAAALSRVPLRAADHLHRLPGPLGTTLGYPSLIAKNRALQQRVFTAASSFVVLSDWAAGVLRANGAPADKVVVNRLGIRSQTPARRSRHAREPIVAAFIGRAEPIKGLDVAVHAVRRLDASVPIELQVIAPARSVEERAFVASCRATAAGDPRIRFVDALPPHDVAPRLAAVDVLLTPSRVVEGGPTIALEALAVGTPVIGSALPALAEIIRDGVNGRLHAPGDAAALAAILREVAADPSQLDHWGRYPHRPRTMDEVADDYLELYGAAS